MVMAGEHVLPQGHENARPGGNGADHVPFPHTHGLQQINQDIVLVRVVMAPQEFQKGKRVLAAQDQQLIGVHADDAERRHRS